MRENIGPIARGTALILTFCGLLLTSENAFGAGGSCPSGASYLTTTGTLTTLSNLGVTSCYYIAANGSDSNNGTSELTPWLHAPAMPNCSGNCATLQASMKSAGGGGLGFIFRGGDTWHFGDNTKTPYTGGQWGFNNVPISGKSGSPIYLGVDPSWYSGSSWARPILTYDNPANSSQTLSSCPIPTPGNMIDISGQKYFIIDNFEMTGICTTSSFWNAIYVNYGSMSGYANFYNLYIHGWSHVGFPSVQDCTTNSTCMSAFRGSVITGPPYDTLLYDVVDGSDSDPVPMEFCYCGAWHVANSYFNNGSQFITRSQNSFHDSSILNFANNGHANVMESTGDVPGPSNAYAIYNNVFAHLYIGSKLTSNVCFWPYPPVGATLYWFNNVVYDIGPCELFNGGENGANQGTVARFNDTFQNNHRPDGLTQGFSCSATGNSAPYEDSNIHFISDEATSLSALYSSSCSGQGTNASTLLMTNSVATSDGYTSSETYAFSPPSSSSPTVGAGTNEGSANNAYCSALSTAANADSFLSDAAAACLNDTRYACTYSSTNHTLTCPARTALARPSSGKWDIGAYQSGDPAPPQPPTNVQATAH